MGEESHAPGQTVGELIASTVRTNGVATANTSGVVVCAFSLSTAPEPVTTPGAGVVVAGGAEEARDASS